MFPVEKVFELYPCLPPELRMMIVDTMEPDDRCRFSGSSKLSNKEAKDSKNYIYEVHIESNLLASSLSVRHASPHPIFKRSRQGFVLSFERKMVCGEMKYTKIMEYRNMNGDLLWFTDLDYSTDLMEYAVQQLQNVLKSYHNTIKSLIIDVPFSKKIDFDVNTFNNLERLKIFKGADIAELLPKIRKKLTHLFIRGEQNGRALQDFQQIYQVQENLVSQHTQLNYEQILRLSAPRVSLHIGTLTENDISNLIKSWHSGTKNIKSYSWSLTDSNFDVVNFYRLHGKTLKPSENGTIKIKHGSQEGKMMMIYFMPMGRVLELFVYEQA